MEMLKSKSIIMFFVLVLVVSYISAVDGIKANSNKRSNLAVEKA